MAVTGIRDYLKSKGLADSDITYQNGTVMAKGQRFMDATPEADGVTRADSNTLDNSYNNYDIKQHMKQYLDNSSKPTTPFKYDAQNDPAYQAALRAAQTNSQKAAGNIAADMNKRGLLNSTMTADRGNQAAQAEYSRVSDTILPQLRNQAYGEYKDAQQQDRYNKEDLLKYVTTMYGMNQDDIVNKRTDTQNAFTNNLNTRQDARAEGQMTGSYMPPGAKDSISAILALKQQAEQSGTTPEQMSQFKAAADAERNKLYQMGVDPNVVGFDSDYATASKAASDYRGIPTLQAQGQNFNQNLQTRGQDLQEKQVNAQLTGMLPDGTPTTAEQQRLLANEWKFAESQGVVGEKLGELYNLPANTPTQAAKAQAAQIAISQQNANTSAFSAANSAANATANLRLNQDKFAWDKNPDNPDNKYKNDQVQQRSDQTMYDNGLKAYKETGTMPNYMDKFGINVQGLKNEKTKAEVQGLYGELSSGKLTPEDALKTINDAEKLGLKDPEVINQLKKTIYLQFPEYDPAEIEKRKAKSDTGNKFGHRMFGG